MAHTRLAATFVASLGLASLATPCFSQCLPVTPGPGFYYGDKKYLLTTEAYDADLEVPEKIKIEAGPAAEIADWVTLKSVLADPVVLDQFISETGIPFQPAGGPCSNFFVSNRGSMALDGMISFLARHDAKDEASVYYALDSIGGHTVELGRWTYRSQALIAVPDDRQRGGQELFVILGAFAVFSAMTEVGLALMSNSGRRGFWQPVLPRTASLPKRRVAAL